MDKITVIGAGRSATALINYLLKQAEKLPWIIQVVDRDREFVEQKIGGHPKGVAKVMSVHNPEALDLLVHESKLVISMLPPTLHYQVALMGIRNHCSVLTASYHTKDLWGLDREARQAGVLIMGELGLDPGIDHMSAMQLIDDIKAHGGTIRSFDSVTGGLMDRAAVDGNPWRYKITWNPRNVVLAGKGTAQFLDHGEVQYVPYQRLFGQTMVWDLGPSGTFDSYANRDSLHYIGMYGLQEVQRIYRGTLRYQGFCQAWKCLIQLGLTDDLTSLQALENITWSSWLRRFIPVSDGDLRVDVARQLDCPTDDPRISALAWLGLFGDEKIPVNEGSAADLLQVLLQEKWALQNEDRDRVLMHHQIDYDLNGNRFRRTATLDVLGSDPAETAMSKTVGMPLGILARHLLTGTSFPTGVHIPVSREFYEPILAELAGVGIAFDESTSILATG